MTSSSTFTFILCLGLVSVALAAPTETTERAPTTTTTPAPTLPPTETKKDTTPSAADQNASAPATDESSKVNATASLPVSSTGDAKPMNSTSFTCYGRSVGYYADTDLNCKVYHFCLPGEYNQEVVYQRISYLCLNESVFDQQALDCVDQPKMSAPCKDSPSYYEISNNVLRQAILGKPLQDQTQSATSSVASQPTTTAPASS